MSGAIAFDTHRFVKRLTTHGFTEEQAEVLASEHVDLLNSNLSTKADIAGVRQDIDALRQSTKADIAGVRRDIDALRQSTKADIAGVRRDIDALRLSTKADIDALRQSTKSGIEALRLSTKSDISAAKVDLLKWTYGAMIVQGGLIVGLIKLL